MDVFQPTVPLGQLLQPALDALAEQLPLLHQTPLYPTGFRDLDSLTGGLHPGQLWAITGVSGSGKSVLALDLARNLAIKHGRTVDLVLTREAAPDAVQRLLSAEGRVGLHNMRTGSMSDDDWARLARRMGEVAQSELRIGELAQSLAVMAKPSVGAQVLVLDSVDPSWLNSPFALEGMRRNVLHKGVAAVVVVAEPARDQRRDVEERLFQEADVVVRIYREDQEHPDSPRAGEADLVVRRHRFGPVSTVTVSFQGHYSRFVDMAYV